MEFLSQEGGLWGKNGKRETSTEGIRVLACLGGGTEGGDTDRFEAQTQKAKPGGHEDGKGGMTDDSGFHLTSGWVLALFPEGGMTRGEADTSGGWQRGCNCFTLGMFSLRCQALEMPDAKLCQETRSFKQVRNKGRGFKMTGVAASFISFSS